MQVEAAGRVQYLGEHLQEEKTQIALSIQDGHGRTSASNIKLNKR